MVVVVVLAVGVVVEQWLNSGRVIHVSGAMVVAVAAAVVVAVRAVGVSVPVSVVGAVAQRGKTKCRSTD